MHALTRRNLGAHRLPQLRAGKRSTNKNTFAIIALGWEAQLPSAHGLGNINFQCFVIILTCNESPHHTQKQRLINV